MPARRTTLPTWPEGAVAVALPPEARPLARWYASEVPDCAMSLPGTCLLVRRTTRALLHVLVSPLHEWHRHWKPEADRRFSASERAAYTCAAHASTHEATT